MSVKAAFIVVLGTVIGTQALAEDRPRPPVSDPAIYLQSEIQKIRLEADRISREATRWRAESVRLASEETKTADEKTMRLAAVSREGDSQKQLLADRSRLESDRLDGEAKKLLMLAQEVDPRAQKDLLDRIRKCCRLTAIDLLRQEIIRIAQSLGSDYSPSKP
ncbi:hypothetical protein ABIF64_001737 [Bradyrhizobium japonicum]|uniref:hypothetical protein n=1 Tax=Bradyrhizobium japonicum TaxID=375 RepID=UPI0033974DE3